MKKFWAVGLALIVSVISSRGATTYFGPTYDQATPAIGSGAVNGGKLSLNNNVNTVSAVFTKGIGSFSDVLVIFIDSGPGGFAGTGGFTDNSDSLQRAISGLNSAGTSRATANFVSGFTADYAIAIGGDLGARVYQLVNGGSFVEVRNLHGGFGGVNESSYSFGFDWVDIGLTSGSGNGFTFETSYVTATGSRSLESFESLTGTSGYNTVTFGTYDTYGTVAPVPETTNAALAAFGVIAVGAGVFARVRRLFGNRSSSRRAVD